MNRDATDTLLALLDRLEDHDDGDLAARLEDAVTAAESVLELDGAGLLLAATSGGFVLATASNPAASALERAQQELGVGPGIECTRYGTIVSVPDLDTDRRWPELTARLTPHVRAVLAAPVWFNGRCAGNLNAMCFGPREWSPDDAQALVAYAGVITAFLRTARTRNHDEPLVTELRMTLDGQV